MGKMSIYRIQNLVLFIKYQKSANNIQFSFMGYFNQEVKKANISVSYNKF